MQSATLTPAQPRSEAEIPRSETTKDPTPSPPPQLQATPLQKPQRNNLLIVGVGLSVSIVLGVSGYFAYQYFQLKNQLSQPLPSPLPSEAPAKEGDPTANWQTYTYRTFTIKLPTTWQKDENFTPSPQHTEEARFITTRQTNQSAGGDFTPGFADLTIIVGSNVETGFFELENQPSKQIIVDNQNGEQRNGYGGAAGSVFILKTIVDGPEKPNQQTYTITLTTQDEQLKQTFVNEYDHILSTFQFLDETSSDIQVTTPQPNSTITSPLTITGQADTTWFFEGSFPVKLLDANRNEITSSFVSEVSPGSWMNEGMIDFSGTLEFTTTATSGFLVFQADNPSDLPEHDKSFELLVTFAN